MEKRLAAVGVSSSDVMRDTTLKREITLLPRIL